MKTDMLPNVSRETLDRLDAFADLVLKWTAKINLISKSTTATIWERHILDSAQLFNLAPEGGKWLDLGSGGGFPGIVVAILTEGVAQPHDVFLVESDQRKAVFLRTAIRELRLRATVISERIEDIDPQRANVLSARALADLTTLIGFGSEHLRSDGVALFPKGAQWEKEDHVARQLWSYSCDAVKSKSHPDAAVLKIKDIVRV